MDDQLPALYDLDCGAYDDDLLLWEQLAQRADGPVLELGVGTGRVAAHLTSAGFEVWGIDRSEAMLARARAKVGSEAAGRLSLADMRAFELGRSFGLVFAAFGTFHALLTPDDQLACLRCVQQHLTPGGIFAFDLRPWWFAMWEVGTSAPLTHEWTRPLPETGETVTKLLAVRADPVPQLQHETHLYDRVAADGTMRRTVMEVDARFSTRYEIEGLLPSAGLELEHMYGDFEASPLDGTSEHMIIVARRLREDHS